MIDIILRKDIPKPYLIMAQLAIHDLEGGNVVYANTLKEGLKKSNNEFVCFIGDGVMCRLKETMDYFKENKNFIKLAMISPVISDMTTDEKVYGYSVEPKGVEPITKKKSSNIYPVQVGTMAGAIIRRNVLNSVVDQITGNMLFDSYALSIYLWLTNRMVYINPSSLYVPNNKDLHRAIDFKQDPMKGNPKMEELKKKWQKEAI